jgi:hypothetical protein
MEPRVRDNGAPEATTIQPARPGKAARIVGWIISAIIILWLGVAGTIFALTNRAMVEQTMTDFGYPVSSIMKIQIVLVCCVILYAIPQTAVLGAILLTGYLGGAVAMHVRAADGQWFFPIIFGVLVWLGLVLRDPRLRSLVPLRKV